MYNLHIILNATLFKNPQVGEIKTFSWTTAMNMSFIYY